MTSKTTPYFDQIRSKLDSALSGMERPTASTQGQRQGYPIRPHVELGMATATTIKKERITRNNFKEHCLIESSSNSVRCSFLLKQQHATADPIEQAIVSKYLAFFQQRAEHYHILRRQPVFDVEGGYKYSISFLLLHTQLDKYGQDQMVDTILDFLGQVDRECSHVKISLNARARLVASEFLKAFWITTTTTTTTVAEKEGTTHESKQRTKDGNLSECMSIEERKESITTARAFHYMALD